MLDLHPTATFGQLIAALIEAMPEAVLVATGEVRIVAANTPARAILPALKIGGPLVLALRDPDVLDAIRRVDGSGHMETVAWRDRVPVERSFDVTVAPLDLPDNRRAIVLTLRDLTEARRVERMRADFVSNASHELRTPLASLLGFVETLQGPARDDPRARARFLTIMGEQARRMARLVDDLLSLSRIEQTLHVTPDQPVDLAMVVRHVADTLAPLAQENGVRLDLDAAGAAVVAGDRDELVRVGREPHRERHQIRLRPRREPPRRRALGPRRHHGRVPPQGRGVHRARLRRGDRPGTSPPPDGTLLPRRRGAEPRQGRHRPRPRHRQGTSSRATAAGYGWKARSATGRPSRSRCRCGCKAPPDRHGSL